MWWAISEFLLGTEPCAGCNKGIKNYKTWSLSSKCVGDRMMFVNPIWQVFILYNMNARFWAVYNEWFSSFSPSLLDLQCFLMHSPSHHGLSPSAPEFGFFIVSIFHKVFLFVNFIPELISCLSEFSCISLSFFMTEILNSPSFTSRSVTPWLCVWLLENCLFLLPWWFMVLDVFLCSEQL